MTAASGVPIRFQIGTRTIAAVDRRLLRVPLSLDEALDGRLPALPPLPQDAEGYAVTSLPEGREASLAYLVPGMAAHVRQRYTRYYADLTLGFDAYVASLSANARSGLRRKVKKLAAACGGTADVRGYRTPEELQAFHAVARAISRTTYQERLLDAGLPDTPAFRQGMLQAAAADAVRAWTLHIGGEPAAYLYCPARGRTLVYAYLGHHPRFADLSPGTVLHWHAMRDLMAERRFARFDFTEGEGQHKRQMATDGIACADLLLLRATLANRLTLAALRGFDGAVAAGKRLAGGPALRRWARRLRRG